VFSMVARLKQRFANCGGSWASIRKRTKSNHPLCHL
jgi:hypothetical protein